MYSYADRIRAVELYIKLGLRVRATIRQLGYGMVADAACAGTIWASSAV